MEVKLKNPVYIRVDRNTIIKVEKDKVNTKKKRDEYIKKFKLLRK